MNTDDLTHTLIGCAMRASNTLGVGFKEKVYENALVIELKNAGLTVEQQQPIFVTYMGIVVGDFIADLLVNGTVIVELKAMREIDEFHQAQILNYLKVAGLKIGLILNFGTRKLGIKRMMV